MLMKMHKMISQLGSLYFILEFLQFPETTVLERNPVQLEILYEFSIKNNSFHNL